MYYIKQMKSIEPHSMEVFLPGEEIPEKPYGFFLPGAFWRVAILCMYGYFLYCIPEIVKLLNH